MTWLFDNQELTSPPETVVGFVYCITNLLNNKQYIGKKTFYFSKTKTIKGKKKRLKVESDWKDYYGSSEELQQDVKTFGAENFKREIIHLCKTKGTMSYLELREQVDRRVLERQDLFYNKQIHCRIHTSHLKL